MDNKAWAHVDEKWANFAHDHRNLRLTISTNGFNPFSDKLCQWSTWPLYVMIYNLAPWLTIKHFFVLVALIILGKESVCMNTIDVYLQPLVDELMMLWKLGVLTLDYGQPEGSRGFIFCALVLWTINDFPEYNLLFRCVHQGYMACPMCRPQTTSRHSWSLRKVVYMGHHRWLRHRHPYWMPCFNNAFDGGTKNRDPPSLRSGNEVLAKVVEYEDWIRYGNQPGSTNDPS
jgi:hypothetical protein